MANYAVECRDLTVVRGGTTVLRGLDLHVTSAAITGLLGPSGSGKTTLMRTIVGTQRVRTGQVIVLGRPAGSPALRRRVGYATQNAAVYDDLSVRENLQYFAAVLGQGPAEVDRVLALVDLSDYADRLTARLSGGQRGRVGLAGALLGRPALLVLDEPTVGLDPVLREALWDLFRALAQDGTTVLVSSHVMDEAQRCDELLLLRDGALLAHDTPTHLLRATGTATMEQAFLALVTRAAA